MAWSEAQTIETLWWGAGAANVAALGLLWESGRARSRQRSVRIRAWSALCLLVAGVPCVVQLLLGVHELLVLAVSGAWSDSAHAVADLAEVVLDAIKSLFMAAVAGFLPFTASLSAHGQVRRFSSPAPEPLSVFDEAELEDEDDHDQAG